MERGDKGSVKFFTEHCFYALFHLVCRFVGERDAEYVGGGDAELVYYIGISVCQRLCFARSRACDHTDIALGRSYCFHLGFIKFTK